MERFYERTTAKATPSQPNRNKTTQRGSPEVPGTPRVSGAQSLKLSADSLRTQEKAACCWPLNKTTNDTHNISTGALQTCQYEYWKATRWSFCTPYSASRYCWCKGVQGSRVLLAAAVRLLSRCSRSLLPCLLPFVCSTPSARIYTRAPGATCSARVANSWQRAKTF